MRTVLQVDAALSRNRVRTFTLFVNASEAVREYVRASYAREQQPCDGRVLFVSQPAVIHAAFVQMLIERAPPSLAIST